MRSRRTEWNGVDEMGWNNSVRLALLTMALLTSTVLADANNRYGAPRTEVAPTIDGVVDASWNKAPWDSIPYTYIGTAPTAADFSGRYKVMWDSGHVYILAEIVDDSISDTHADPLDNYHNDDALELFVDENHDGGNHQSNFKAWAYHIGTKTDASGSNDVVDYGDDQAAHLFNDHFRIKRVQTGRVSVWEMSMLVYGDNYTLSGPNTPLVLRKGKSMGFTVAYCDNDRGANRQNFFGSVNTPGHFQNQGYIDATCFGTLELLGDTTTTGIRNRHSPANPGHSSLRSGHDGFRLEATLPEIVEVVRMDGSLLERFEATPGTAYGAHYPQGVYAVRSTNGLVAAYPKFAR
jgi:hypothetical protein